MTTPRNAAIVSCFLALALVAGTASTAFGQSVDDIQLRKQAEGGTKLGFGFVGLFEWAGGINKERPEQSITLYAAPQLKIGDAMRLQLNLWAGKELLERQENTGWDFADASLEFAHLKIWEPLKGLKLSGRARWYFPTSLNSRVNDNWGQIRGYLKVSYSVWKVFFSAEVNAQKYFSKFTTTSTADAAKGSYEWYHQGGRDEIIDNNANYGFGETFTAGISPLDGLDISFVWGMYQNRKYDPSVTFADEYGSSYLQVSRWTTWNHIFRFSADVTYGLGSIPGVDKSPALKDSVLNNFYVSAGYNIMAPQLQNGGKDWSMNPFNPKYGQFYVDLSFIY